MPRRRSDPLLAFALTLAAFVPAASAAFSGGTRDDDVVDPLARARALVEAKDWKGAVDLLQDRLRRDAGDASLYELLGGSLLQLGRLDESAHYLELAVRAYAIDGKDDKSRAVLPLLRRADPLSQRREAFFKKLVDTLYDSAEDLADHGHAERALAILERLPAAAAPGKEAAKIDALLEKVQAAFKTVHLDEQAAKKPIDGEWPLEEQESQHYRLSCHLEPDVVKRLGTVMDDIHAFYVDVYFDGDEKKARGEKPTIRVHSTKEKMLEGWSGGAAPEGWWSPGTNEVITFDTRSQKRSLDDMLVTLFHEASHQFMTLLSRGGFTPSWLNEGTASFFEGTTAMADGRVLWPGPALGRLRDLSHQLREPDPLGAVKVVSYAGAGSYGAEYYAWGWGLVYFLLEYEDPATLQYVYRPLYSEYRTKVIATGGEPMKVFEEVFLGKTSPLGHKTFAEFERDWRKWILETLEPLYSEGSKARELHLTKVRDYLLAAETLRQKPKDKSKVTEEELVRRALGHVEYVRAHLDKDDKPDGELIVQQADLLERLKRQAAAAPLLEKALDLADQGKFEIDAARYAALEKRLQKIDGKNAALRSARSKTQNLARTAAAILDDYKSAKENLLLRSYSFAAIAGALLQDDKVLLPAADALRARARDAHLLLGQIRAFSAPKNRWKKPSQDASPPNRFAVEGDKIQIDCVRSAMFVDPDVPITGEYEIRVRLARASSDEPGSAVGVVVAGRPDGNWQMVGLDERGTVGIWKLELTGKAGTVLQRMITLFPKPAIDVTKPIDLVVHVARDGRMQIKAGDAEPVEGRVDLDPGVVRHVGVFAKYVDATFTGAVVESYP
jgi:hypothetical protein